MFWTVACACGLIWRGQPDDACPRCAASLAPNTADQAAREFADNVAADLERLPTTDEP